MQLEPLHMLCDHPDFKQYQIGRYTYAGRIRVLFATYHPEVTLRIGCFCSIADEVDIYLGGNHRTDFVSTWPFNTFIAGLQDLPGHPATRGGVTIGSDVWIGRGASIMSGVTLSHGAVVGARSVVTRDVEPYTIVAGNPARVINRRVSPEQAAALVKIAWWDWEDEVIFKNAHALMSPDIDSFIKEHQ